MPKIIMNLESRLMEEANRQVLENGYSNTTIRSIATACGVGVGTVYNYFESKEALLSRYLVAEWTECITAINAVSTYSDNVVPVLRCIYDRLQVYTRQNHALFQDPDAAASFSNSFNRHRKIVREQLSEPLRKFCQDDFTAEFIAENMLIWTSSHKEFDDLCRLILKLL